jgi:hypothetical protein
MEGPMGDDTRGPRERAYDEEVAPLMDRIIQICKEHSIPMLADFELDPIEGSPPEHPMKCTTCLLDKATTHDPRLWQAARLLSPRPRAVALAIEERPDGTKRVLDRQEFY